MSKKARTEMDEQGFVSLDSGCPHYFGYLGKRAKGEGIPEECLACEKAVECMLSEPEGTSLKPKAKQRQLPKKEVLKESVKQVVEEIVEEETEKAVKEKPKHETEIQPAVAAQPSENQFIVENLGMLYATWTSTVRIPKETLSQLGKKVKEVEIETLDGKKTRCKVASMESSKGNIIEVPDKVQHTLGIMKGDLVKVKPCK
ncbi:MAG: hypothetical protein ACPLRY_04685 [Candidatus Bathyarchaeales archaeon]